ncbi:hypothetical protein TVAG_077900 [Trichomonas vaginalis G3]|uniref:Uncharacterized protein n=1 Tax=Trichomonas vaginalis (strain ATCC PRA-98 / G3) TaxID=412133 RepID=A2FGM4_TRIV3|nr:hypothetical protein TVAGG3_1028280 [Trichomonas vaginalis G3]EAX95948.1 hypothetical protein TVAG_077900 [Trichomonas vaginalis G3]KAI5492665.1 hypothetical protein TVAGG3_1028280 [Trichomonas vaginalis G3]|eukprot:XP_001308878.1 hypothetical protein [Trichomonas vaginalis G3]
MDLVNFITTAFTEKSKEIEETQRKIAEVTNDYNNNIKLVQQRDDIIRQLKATLAQTEKHNKTVSQSINKTEKQSKQYEIRAKQLEQRIQELMKEVEEKSNILTERQHQLSQAQDEYSQKRQMRDLENHKRLTEYENQKQTISSNYQAAQNKILELQSFARKMRNTAAIEIDKKASQHSLNCERQRNMNLKILKVNEELSDTYAKKVQEAESSIRNSYNELQVIRDELQRSEQEKVDAYENNIQYLKTHLTELSNQNTILTEKLQQITQQREARESIIEDLRVQYSNFDGALSEQEKNTRLKIKKKARIIKEGKEQNILMQKQEESLKLEIQSLKEKIFSTQAESQRIQEKISKMMTECQEKRAEAKKITENQVKKRDDLISVFQDISNQESALKDRVRNASQELKRQINEQKRVSDKMKNYRNMIHTLQGEIVRLRTLIKPSISSFAVKPGEGSSEVTNEKNPVVSEEKKPIVVTEEDTYGLSQNRLDISDLPSLHFSDDDENDESKIIEQQIDEMRVQVMDMKKIVDEKMEDLETKRKDVEELKNSEELVNLKQKNEELKQKMDNFNQMKDDIEKINKSRKSAFNK